MAETKEVTTFKEFTVTTKGLLLEAKVKAGETVFKYTRAIIGCGILPDGYNVLSMTALIEEIPSHQTGQEGTSATVDLSRCYKMAEGVVGLTVQVKNGDKGFRLREIAIMALDPDEGEILYAYGYAGIEGEPFSAFDGKTPIRWNLTIPFIVSNFDVDKIIANITLPAEVSHEEFDAHTTDQSAHTRICCGDTEPEGVNYLWFAPYEASAAVNKVVLQTAPYNGETTKLHIETDGETKTASNTEVDGSEGAAVVVIK